MIKVVLVDDQRLVVEGIKSILERAEDIKVVGVASDVRSAIQLCTQHEPDVVMMDIHMPGFDGIGLTSQIHQRFPLSRIIILTGHQDMESVIHAMKNGASGYMLKNINPDELVMTVKSTALGLSVMHKDVLVKFTRAAPAHEIIEPPPQTPSSQTFTEREMQIIQYVVEGKENREIAMSMFLSLGTVKKTLSHILKKVDVKDRIELVVYAMKNNMF